MKLISTIKDFGGTDADNDPLLYDAFESHEAYTQIIDGSRFLVIGRKGSGKTAIFKMLLTQKSPQTFTYGFTFADYPWHHHDAQAKIGVPDFEKFKHSWTYFILMSISKIALNQDQSIPFDDDSLSQMAKLEKFVIDAYGSRDVDVTQIFSPKRRLNIKGNLKLNLEFVEAGIDAESLPIENLPSHFPEVNRTLLEAIMTCLNPANRYYICFDQLDHGLDVSNDNYVNRIIGLLLACRDINQAARASGKYLTVGVFLRDDIYDILKFEDKNKITENHVSKIEWDSPTTSHTLKELMERRFQIILREAGEQISWDHVFDEAQEMTGRQKKYNHILDRTFNRPRDIIKFSNLLIARLKIRKRLNPTSIDKFTNEDINSAKDEYSNYFYKEIDDEIHKHIPNYEKYLDVLRDIGTWYFNADDFRVSCEKLEIQDNILELMGKLYEFSIIGYLRSGGRSSGSQYVFRYKNRTAPFDVRASRFRVHPGLIEHLDLKRNNARTDSTDIGSEDDEYTEE